MRDNKLLILSGLIIIIAIPFYALSLPVTIIDEKIDISHHLDYAEVTLHINSSTPISYLAFNVSGFKDRIKLAYVEINGKVESMGRLENNTLVFPLNNKVQSLIVKIFYNKVFQVNESNIIASVPVMLSPLNLKSNITLQVLYPSSQVVFLNLNASATGGILELNYSNVEPGASNVILASLDPRLTSIVRFSGFRREIVVEPGEQLQIVDKYEVEGLSSRKLEELAFLYPKYMKISGVEGPLGPYPLGTSDIPFYSPSYRVYEFGEFLRVRVRLRSPPLNIGDKTYFLIKLAAPANFSKDILVLNPFFGVGYLLDDYSIVLRVRGKVDLEHPAAFSLENLGKENNFNLYMLRLKENLPIYKSELFPSLTLRTRLTGKPGPNYALIALLIILFGGVGVVTYRVRRREGVKEAKRRALETVQHPEIYTISRSRVELMESILNSWNKMEDGRITHTTYKQTVAMVLHRENSLSKKFNEVVIGIKDDRVKNLLERIEEHITSFKTKLRELEDLSREFRRGKLSKGEYKGKRNRLISAMEKEISEAYRIIEDLREALYG